MGMIYIPTSAEKHKSKNHDGYFWYLYFKREDGRSFKTYLDPTMANFHRWKNIKDRVEAGEVIELDGDGLRELDGQPGIINADSEPIQVN